MCIPHVRVGSYAHQHESGMSAQMFEILLQGRFLFLVGLFVCFSKMLFIYLRERGEKKHEREEQWEREKQDPC